MPGPVSFDIDYTVSPAAVSRTLEYRFVNPFGVFSPWTTNLATGVNTPINTQNGTVLNFTINPAVGDINQFYYNTVYEFRIKTICQDGTIEYSPGGPLRYKTRCPNVKFSKGARYTDGGNYTLDVTLYDPAGNFPMNPLVYSIEEYVFEVYSVVGSVRTLQGTFTASVVNGDIVPGSPYYDFTIDDADLINGVQSGTIYQIDLSFTITDGTNSITVECGTQQVTLPSCSRYKIYTGEWWYLQYTDCNGVIRTVTNNLPQPLNAGLGPNWFYICSQTEPKGYACLINPTTGVYSLQNPAYAPIPGQVVQVNNPVPTGWPFGSNVIYGAVVERDTTNECAACYNGDVTVISQSTGCYPNGPINSIPTNCS